MKEGDYQIELKLIAMVEESECRTAKTEHRRSA